MKGHDKNVRDDVHNGSHETKKNDAVKKRKTFITRMPKQHEVTNAQDFEISADCEVEKSDLDILKNP